MRWACWTGVSGAGIPGHCGPGGREHEGRLIGEPKKYPGSFHPRGRKIPAGYRPVVQALQMPANRPLTDFSKYKVTFKHCLRLPPRTHMWKGGCKPDGN